MKKPQLFIALAILLALGASCSQTSPRLPFLPPAEPVPPPEMRWEVRTDFSILTPYVPPHAMHTRLRDGALPELLPSHGFGMLLPYASSTVLPDGMLRESKFGLVTIGGVIVTDLVYDRIDRAYAVNHVYYSEAPLQPLPAYRLTVFTPGTETPWGYSEARSAVCALDGSWITPFDYIDAVFTDDVIMLLRGHGTFDVDVYDYNGRRLYNMLDLDWIQYISEDAWPGELLYGVSEGIGSVSLSNGARAFIDIRTGVARYTEYTQSYSFSEGLAAVAIRAGGFGPVQELWGFINRDFELVIPHIFTSPGVFRDGRAIIQTQEGSQQIIDTLGRKLFSAPTGTFVEHNYTGPSFAVYDTEGRSPPQFYTIDFDPIRLPERVLTAHMLEHIGDGWFFTSLFNGSMLFNHEREYFFPDVSRISFFDGDLIIYIEHDGSGSLMGLMTLDGREVIPMERNVLIEAVVQEGRAEAIIVNSPGSMLSYFAGNPQEYRQSRYRLTNAEGGILASGPGRLSFDESAGLYALLGPDHFSWLDRGGNVVISIPHLWHRFD
jgi:hypothetical protein